MEIIIAIISLLVGFILNLVGNFIWQKYKFSKELKDNDNIDISGKWYAAWQTSVKDQQIINSEHIEITQKGKTIHIKNLERAPENPEGGYLWEGQMQFFHAKTLMGWYKPLPSENNTSKGIMYFSYFAPRKIFYGQWVGSSYDGDFITGYLVISNSRGNSISLLNRMCENYNHPIKISVNEIN